MKKKFPTLRGFTFIELLVVITIIAVLTTIGVISYASVNKRSRDTKRQSDIEQLRSALEMYRADNGYYPSGPGTFSSLSGGGDTIEAALASYIPKLPTPPKGVDYVIEMTDVRTTGDGDHYYGYCLAAALETLDDEGGTSAGTGENQCTVSLPDTYNYGRKNP